MQGWGSVDGIDGHIPEAELAWNSWYQSTSMDLYIYIYIYLWRVVAYYALIIFAGKNRVAAATRSRMRWIVWGLTYMRWLAYPCDGAS